MKYILPIALLLLAACGTATPDSRYYTLSPSPASTQDAVVSTVSWSLDTVMVPELLNRQQMIMKSGANGINLLEYDRWAEPMEDMTHRILTEDMISRLGVSYHVPGSDKAENRVTVSINEFDADDFGHVQLTAVWTVKTRDMTVSHVFQDSSTVDGREVTSLVKAMSRLLGNLASTIAVAVAMPVKAT